MYFIVDIFFLLLEAFLMEATLSRLLKFRLQGSILLSDLIDDLQQFLDLEGLGLVWFSVMRGV